MTRAAATVKEVSQVRGRFLVAALLLLGLAGCESGTPAEITARATVDTANASIGLPLDGYGMSGDQENILNAAQQVVFARCVLASNEVPAVTLQTAGVVLNDHWVTDRWVFGYWDAAFIAANGAATGAPVYGVGQGLNVTSDQGVACVNTDEYKALNVIDGNTITSSWDEDGASAGLLMSLEQTAYAQTLSDSRFKTLAKARATCLTAQGFAIDPTSDYQGVQQLDDWTPEQTTRAILAEAQCSDEADFTQQAADINATYQQALIGQHEAELVVVQQTVRDRVAKAETILHDVGLM